MRREKDLPTQVPVSGGHVRQVASEPDLGPPIFDLVESGVAFAALRLHWDELLESSDAGVFNSWSWLYPWFRRIGKGRTPFILTARDARGGLIGLMALCLETRSILGRPLRRLSFLGETHVGSDYLDVVAVRGREAEIAKAFAQRLLEMRSRWDVLDLGDLRSDSPTLEVFQADFRHEVQRTAERYVCPYQPLVQGQSFDDFLKSTARRDNFLRRQKWLAKQPGYRLEIAERPAQLGRALEDFFRLHRLRWTDDGGSQGIRGPGVEAFHRDATQFLAEDGRLRLFSLQLGARTLASVYGIVHGGKFIFFQSGYDPAWANKSVGLVLVGETFRTAHEERLREYDFLRGTETYKADWARSRRTTVTLRIYAPRSTGMLLTMEEEAARLARNCIKAVIPDSAVEQVRRLRRRRAVVR